MPAAFFFAAVLVTGTPPGQAVISSLDLKAPFQARSAWALTARQGPEIDDPILGDDKVPGVVTLCLSRDDGRTCDPAVTGAFPRAEANDVFGLSHFLLAAKVEPASRPVLLVRTGTLHSVNGNQGVRTQLLVYDRQADAFRVAYDHVTGHNNNEDVRLLETGPLRGDVISAEPTDDKPYGYWMTVSRLGAKGQYRQVLRYRSATHYGDGNPLAVIDSEMPTIQKRLGVWHAGQPLPLPAGTCARPHLVKAELWCQ